MNVYVHVNGVMYVQWLCAVPLGHLMIVSTDHGQIIKEWKTIGTRVLFWANQGCMYRLSSALQPKSREKVGIKIGKSSEKVGIIGVKK